MQTHIKDIEKIQKRATKIIEDLKHKDYHERLKLTGLTTLETRRLRADLVEVYKIFNDIDKVNKSEMFILDKNRLRGHEYKLFKNRFNTNACKFMFKNRIVDEWN